MSWWIPTAFRVINKKNPIFMSATHRGDMYHVRALMILDSRPIYLYDYTDANKKGSQDLVDYLTLAASSKGQSFFVTPWDRATCLDQNTIPPLAGCLFNGEALQDVKDLGWLKRAFLTEGDVTLKLITLQAYTPTKLKTISDGMAIIPDAVKNKLDMDFDHLYPELFGGPPRSGRPTVLVLHRDTGKNLGGAYPELDSGEAILDIVDVINHIPKMRDGEEKQLRPVLCGNALGTFAGIDSINQYWSNFTAPPRLKRDVEAYFLKRAFDKGYFQIVAGFRSGGLDLFTLMCIPTVSVGLRNLVGEDRHGWLARIELKRINVQYDQPRHHLTASVKGRDGVNLLNSPFWNDEPPVGISHPRDRNLTKEQKIVLLADEPSRFTAFDKYVFDTGFKVACQLYLGWDQLLVRLLSKGECIITTSVARYCYPLFLSPDEIIGHFKTLGVLDNADIDLHIKNQTALQETEADAGAYQTAYKRDWSVIQNFVDKFQDI